MCEFCRSFHAKSAEGYFSLSPGQPLIQDPSDTFQKFDIRNHELTPASGYSVIVGSKMIHLGKVPLAKARRVAMKSGDVAKIAAAVGFMDVDDLVWRYVETIDRAPGGRIICDDGHLMCKANPEAQIEDMTDAYADKLKAEYAAWAKGQMDPYFDVLDVDWYDVNDVEAVFEKAGETAITNKSDVKRLSAAWIAGSLLYSNRSAAQAREQAKLAFLPKIGSSISDGDRTAMNFLSRQNGFFVRDHLGRVDAGLTKAGKQIVNRGIRDGIGYREIGKELREQLPGMWGKYGANYSNVVANAGVQRSRAFAQVTAYQEAGIEFAELIAILDQRTTDICRYLDGQVIRVNSVAEILNQTLEIENPEEIKNVSPWVSTKKNAEGQPQLVTRNGVVLADILRSGVGNLDDNGQYRARIMGEQLGVDASIGPPPYHGYCRTTMNPVVKTFSVPPKRYRVAIPTPPLKPKDAAKVITPTYMRGLTGAAFINAIGSSDRGHMTGRLPNKTHHELYGSPGDPETGVWADDGWLEALDATEQVERRTSNSAIRLSTALSELYRAKGRKDLSYKAKGELIRSIFLKRISELRKGPVTMQKVAFSSHDRVKGDMSQTDADKIRRSALRFLSDRLQKVVARRKLPRIVEKRSPKSRPTGYWNNSENVFYLPKADTSKRQAVILRAFAEYFDTFGNAGKAAVIARNGNLASDTVHNVNGVLYLDVRTASFFDGLIVDQVGPLKVNSNAGIVTGASEIKSEWTKSAFESLANGFETNLGFLWDTAPMHVAFLLAYIEGQFV